MNNIPYEEMPREIDRLLEEIEKKEAMYDSLAVDYRLSQEENEKLRQELDNLRNDKDIVRILNDNVVFLEYDKKQKEKINALKKNIEIAINFIDQVLQYHLQPFDYKRVDEDINTLIGILRGDKE